MTAASAGNASFNAAFSVDQARGEVFHAINNVRGWWSEDTESDTDKANGEFSYWYEDTHRCRIKVTELVASRRVAWHVLDTYFDFTQDKAEWEGTEIRFDISARDGKTRSASPTSGWYPRGSALTSARTPGSSTSTPACAP